MAGKLPQNIAYPAMLTQWAQQLNPFLGNVLVNGSLLPNIALKDGTVTFNHYLGRQMQGWYIVDIDGAATVFRPSTSPMNSQTLTLTSSAAVTVNLWVF